ncbi:polyphosphate kinase 1 [Elongatibacter sediminis]|uniref:Polyphosphate kinase n=1 Tax=Elongatibacter sediminis TaxID=3119006 RepID=A0AAW9RML5_9GAMM
MGEVASISRRDGARQGPDIPGTVGLRDPRLYINRELSQLEFIGRVLRQAVDEQVPLLERLRFLCITCLLVDEFFEVRVASLKQRIQHGAARPEADGMTPSGTLQAIRDAVLHLVAEQYRVLDEVLVPALAAEEIRFLAPGDWTGRQRDWLHKHFRDELMPVLSPLGLDPVHPFPRILSKSLNCAVELRGKDAFGRDASMALVRAPRSLPRVIHIPASHTRGAHDFVLLGAVLQAFAADLFPGMEVLGSHQFRVTRNSELLVDEDEIENLASALEGELAERGFAAAVRLETTTTCPPPIEKFLASQFGLQPDDIYHYSGPVNLNRLSEAITLIDRPDLKYPVFEPVIRSYLAGEPDWFDVLRRRDIMLHHPYESFQPVIDLLRQASRDPQVLAISQTLYRTGIDSQIVNLLVDAARNGKDVTVVVEIRARFDEEANISLATRLQRAGVQVVYGVVGRKTHAKMLMIVRRETRQIRKYVHLGTGNYHSGTATLYTDIGLLTSDPEITEDVSLVFRQLSGRGRLYGLKRLMHSPFTLHKQLIEKIKREEKNAREGLPAGIDVKLNALTEPKIIKALYSASRAGVPIRLLVRGMCCLRPGVPGVSETIEVRSVIGRFLEHARIYRFENAGDAEYWGSSADWMERNLVQRVEVAFPIDDPALRERIDEEIFNIPWRDNMIGWCLGADGTYRPNPSSGDVKAKHPQQRLLKVIKP